MSNQPISMSTVRQILRLLGHRKTMQAIIEMTGVSRNTLRKYQQRFTESGFGLDELLQLGDKDLHELFLRTPEQKPNAKVQALFALIGKAGEVNTTSPKRNDSLIFYT